ncbi:MAG TPA: hypothetical protein DIT49_01195 [Clostridiales bacterium]|nr:hypothetical protein [Clostridiales bacterium]
MRKCIGVVGSLIVLLFLNVTAFASDGIPEVGFTQDTQFEDTQFQDKTMVAEDVEVLSPEEYEEILEEVSKYAESCVTPERVEEMKKFRQEAESIVAQFLNGTAFAWFTQDTQLQDAQFEDTQFQDKAMVAEDVEVLSLEEYEEILEEVSKYAEAYVTPERVEEMKRLRQEVEESLIMQLVDENIITSKATLESIKREAALCLHDGLSAADISLIGIHHARIARDDAKKLYKDEGQTVEMKRDAFRHMTWNFTSSRDVGEGKTRIATINHEWYVVIQNAVNQYEKDRFNYYLAAYQSELAWGTVTTTDLLNMAIADADVYAIAHRDALIQKCKGSLAMFNATFSNANIMDLWNNKTGIDYAKSNPTASTNTVFTLAWNRGELIKHEGAAAVTASKRSIVYRSNWWYIK